MVTKAGANIFIVGNKCYRCGHEWIPSNKNQTSKVCPRCKSPYWDRPKINFGKGKKQGLILKK
jgi:predicted Zn-ribbon and HTH transcriptional regulator